MEFKSGDKVIYISSQEDMRGKTYTVAYRTSTNEGLHLVEFPISRWWRDERFVLAASSVLDTIKTFLAECHPTALASVDVFNGYYEVSYGSCGFVAYDDESLLEILKSITALDKSLITYE